VEQSTIDSAAALTNSIEQRAAEIRDSAEEGPAEVNPGPTYGYSKEGKPVVEKEPISPAVQLKRWDVWAVGTGLFGHYDDFNNLHYAAGQFTVGLDYRVMPHWLVGILGDYTYASGSFAGRNFNANTFRGGVYTSVWHGGWYGTLAALIGTTDYHTNGTTDGMDYTGYAGTGYAWRFGSLEIGPWVGLEYDYADGFIPLRELASRVGGRAAWHAGKWTPYVQIGWQHEYLDTFTGIDRNAAWGSVGVAYRVNDALRVFTDYWGEVGGDYWVQQIDVGMGYSW
jgi:uncharacterized protein with beta-barrel porin domain